MSEICDVCGPGGQKECPTVICAPCALMGCGPSSPEHGHRLSASQVPGRTFIWISDPAKEILANWIIEKSK